METIITDFSISLFFWQLFNILLAVFFIYFMVKVIKYINNRQKLQNR
ncbi:hypothetical protein [Flavobacterium akiainvivens]|nr:hypothetical protein [Flavobacterium akiainvivens]SFQ58657.1 hypothetical protein SAMN05444144_10930 [Flavobacterium akiainvivens]